MGFAVGIAKLALPLLFSVGVIGTMGLASSEGGLFDLIGHTISGSKLPDSNYSLRQDWTGLQPVDYFLSAFITFFWPIVDGQNPTLSLQAVHFWGQISSTWLLVLIESFRVGNRWRLVSFAIFWGLGIELLSGAITVPIYCFLHLLSSPSARSTPSMSLNAKKTCLLIHPSELRVLPWSAAAALFVPLALIFCSTPSETEQVWTSQQFWIAARALSPVFSSISYLLLSVLNNSRELAFSSATERNLDVLRHLNGVYSLAKLLSVVPHVGTMTLILCAKQFPSLITPTYQAAFDPMAVFKPIYFWEESRRQTQNVATGSLMFLQWDEIVSCAAILTWAIALNRQTVSHGANGSSFLTMIVRTALWTVIGGPAAAAVSLIQERDQVTLYKVDVTEEKKNEETKDPYGSA